MTMLEKAKEMGLKIEKNESGEWAHGCPHEFGFSLFDKDERHFCRTHTCVECYAREYNPPAPAIKDSGERTQFPSGAVRDMHEGKGRFDLLPMCVLMRLARHYENGCKKYGDRNWEAGIPCHSFADSAMRHLVKYMDGQTDEDHLIAAIWNLCGLAWNEEKRPDLMDIPARLEGGTGNG